MGRQKIIVLSQKRMKLLLLLLAVGLVSCTDEDYLWSVVNDGGYMTTDDTPTAGPEMPDTVYVPGTPGAPWTDQEVASTRKRILMMIFPDWTVKYNMGIANKRLGSNDENTPGQCTENILMRLIAHDCFPYADGTGGCDGCLNWHGMYEETPNPNDPTHFYQFDPVNATDNKGLDGVAEKLEIIYSTIDWPFKKASLEVSLKQAGKSRADLWQFAGLVALEQAFERANRACDLDKWGRQQVTLLESREACEIKLTKPFKFQTGRSDCVPADPTMPYVASKPESQPMLMGDGNHVVDYGKNFMGVESEGWTALQAIHGAVHAALIGLKYTWFGPGYISNMYFKMIANKPIYQMVTKGGDLSFYSGDQCEPIVDAAIGDTNGNPVAMTGWRASCMYLWNTTEGGPCVLRPIPVDSWDAPNPNNLGDRDCVTGIDENDQCIIDKSSRRMQAICGKTKCDADRIVSGAGKRRPSPKVADGPWKSGLRDQQNRHYQGWSNQFAFPYELGLYWKMTTGGVGQRAVGCTGLDEPFGEVEEYGTPNWPYRNNNSPIHGSPAMDCEVNDYAPDGKTMASIVEKFAEDNEYFAEKFMEGWQQMTANGYGEGDLEDGPESSWVGHYSLTAQGVDVGPDFAGYIANNSPVWFTDENADPWICGHRGHSATTCGVQFSKYYETARARPEC